MNWWFFVGAGRPAARLWLIAGMNEGLIRRMQLHADSGRMGTKDVRATVIGCD